MSRKKCQNQDNSLGEDDFDELMKQDEMYYPFRDEFNNCYTTADIRNLLFTTRKNVNPYDPSKKLWTSKEHLMGYLQAKDPYGKPIFTDDERKTLIEIYYPTSHELDNDLIEKIGWTGCILKADNTTNYVPSLNALSQLKKSVESIKDNKMKQKFLDLEIKGVTLSKILYCEEDEECVHGIGSRLIDIYLREKTKDLLPCFIEIGDIVIFPYLYDDNIAVVVISPLIANYKILIDGEWKKDNGYSRVHRELKPRDVSLLDNYLEIVNHDTLLESFSSLLNYCEENKIPSLLS